MFYGGGGANRGGDRGLDGPRGRLERYDQMSKQQQLIEQKKREIELKLQAENHKKAMEAMLGKQGGSNEQGNTETKKPASAGIVFANDGSFMEQFKRLQEQKLKEEKEAQLKSKVKVETGEVNEYGASGVKKPLIKIMNVGQQQPRKSPTLDEQDRLGANIKHHSAGSNSYSAVPPPPPPPPPPLHPPRPQIAPLHQHERHISAPVFNPNQYSANYNNAPPPPPPPSYAQQQQRQGAAGFPSAIVKNFAATVADKGDQHEDSARLTNNPLLWFLNRPDSEEYRLYRDLVLKLRAEKVVPVVQNFNSAAIGVPRMLDQGRTLSEYKIEPATIDTGGLKREIEDEESQNNAKKRSRSRWGPQDDNVPPPSVAGSGIIPGVPPPLVMSSVYPGIGAVTQPNALPSSISPPGLSQNMSWPGLEHKPKLELPFAIGNIPGISAADLKGPSPILTAATRTNPQLLDYARQSYGTIQLDEEQWKQCEDAYKMNLLFQDIARKKAKDEKLAQAGKFKHQYDSDEEIDDQGTWEHKKRLLEMEKTKQWANELTSNAKGKHHIGDFLPPEELEKFMDKYKAVKEGRQMTQSAYEDFKIAQDNVGFKLLQKMGWVDGQGLGATSQGITAPIDKGTTGSEKHGLGMEQPDEMREDDDEYSAYRKRMMLAYRFRPNPLNNPRRAYY